MDSNRLPNVFVTGESITSQLQITPQIVEKFEIVSRCVLGTRRSCSRKKLETKNLVSLPH
jgi:hypothetical protein